MNFIERTARTIFSGVFREQEERYSSMLSVLLNAYMEGGQYAVAPDVLKRQLSELDSALLQDILDNLLYDSLSVTGVEMTGDIEKERKVAVESSRRMWRRDVLTQWIVWLWTNFGFGENVEVFIRVPEETTITPDLQAIWNAYWESDANLPVFADDRVHRQSERLLVDGEFYYTHFVNTVSGDWQNGNLVTTRITPTDEVVEYITDSEDALRTIWYKRAWKQNNVMVERYYPHWLVVMSNNGILDQEQIELLPPNQRDAKYRADVFRDGTLACMMHVPFNVKAGLHGWPLMTAGAPWSRAHKQFREDRASVAAAVAMYINKLKVKGGSRAVDAVKSIIQSKLSSGIDANPPAAAGSTWLENEAADLTRMPLSTGAGDAKSDGEALLHMAALGGGVFPHWAGVGDAYRLATATSMEGPLLREFARYQKFWSAQVRKLTRFVMWSAERYADVQLPEKYTVEVSTDRLVESDLESIARSVGTLTRDALSPLLEQGLVDNMAAGRIMAYVWRLALQALGSEDASEIASDEAFISKTVQQAAAQGGDVAEAIDEETGKVTVRGRPTKTPKTAKEIDVLDVARYIRSWNNDLPPEFYGLLMPQPVEK